MEGVYILKLSGGKYYVGSSENVNKRIQSHFSKRGSEWTKKHDLNVVEDVIEAEGESKRKFLERATTLSLMEQYDWENVRGYSWSQVELQNKPIPLR